MTNSSLRMRRNCNLELRLSPSSAAATPTAGESKETPKSQQLTIFYNGEICVCDVTELQARAIIMMATREMEEKLKKKSQNGSEPCSPISQQPQTPKTPGLSMKKSLQRFLQKRKHRVQVASPYHH